MKKLFTIIFLFTNLALANTEDKGIAYSMAGLEGGFLWGSADVSSPAPVSSGQNLGFRVGGSIVFDFAGNLGLKTGIFYTERALKSTIAGTTLTARMTYIDIPVFLMYKFADNGGVYAGPTLASKLSQDASTGFLNNVRGTVVPLTFGVQFMFTSNLGINAFVETIPGSIADDISSFKAIGAGLVFAFD